MTGTTTTTTTSTVMPVDPSNTLTLGISGLDAQTHSIAVAAIPQTETTTTASLAIRTQIMDFVCFTEVPTCALANAYPCTFEFGGDNYQNATACFLAQKYTDQPEKMALFTECATAEEAQFLDEQFVMTDERAQSWENPEACHVNKLDVMMYVLRAKFGQNLELKEQLLSTGNLYIACQGYDLLISDGFNATGQNLLGNSLMQLRGEYTGDGIVPKSLSYELQLEGLTTRCFDIMLNCPEDLIGLFYEQCWSNNDITGIQALACTNKHFYTNISTIVEKIDLNELCPLLQIIKAEQAKQCGFTANKPTSVLPKLGIFKAYQAMSPHIEGNAGVTYFNFTLRDGLTLRKIVEIAKGQGIKVDIWWNQILLEIGDVAIAQVLPGMGANNVFKESRNKNFNDQRVLVQGHGCELPTVGLQIMHIVLIQKISDRCLFGQDPFTYSRSVTRVQGRPLVVGGSAPACLCVDGVVGFDHEYYGAGGWRKF